MSEKYKDAGELRERPEVLELQETESGFVWQPKRRTWASAELSVRRNVWSVHGIGAAGVTFIMRRQPLTMDHALRWKDQHCFITSIAPWGRSHIKVEAALVVVTECENKYENVKFPGIITEEYHRHEQLEPQAINILHHVLVTPKRVELKPGRLVEVGDVRPWNILTAHRLDPHKNEYIIERVMDL